MTGTAQIVTTPQSSEKVNSHCSRVVWGESQVPVTLGTVCLPKISWSEKQRNKKMMFHHPSSSSKRITTCFLIV